MLWRSLLVTDLATTVADARGAQAVELRLDNSPLSGDELRRLIAAIRVPTLVTDHDGLTGRMCDGILAGADMIDVGWDPETPTGLDHSLVSLAHAHGCRVVGSFHDFEKLPPLRELREIIDGCFAAGADIAKIACTVSTPQEAARVISLLDDERPIVAIGMGRQGRITRVTGAILGCPIVFVAPDDGPATAPGQLTERAMKATLAALGRP